MIIDKIFHIADIHIRNYQRHTEYQNVFKRLFKYIKENKTKNSIIYLAGDIVHQKTDLSPELVSMTGTFLKSCADICPTILICGNHDANLNNTTRLDSLSPIVDNIKHKKLFYWKDSGVYKLSPDSNVTFGVYSVFDSIDKWPRLTEKQNGIHIALHHGAVNGATTDMNHNIVNESVTTKDFRYYDYVLLGDIHKQQYLNEEKTIAYSSSLIQQNYGESIDNHGIIVWDLNNNTNQFVSIENDICYYTAEIINNEIVKGDIEEIRHIPKYVRLRIKHENSELPFIHDYLNKVKKIKTIKEYSLRKITSGQPNKITDISIGNVRDIEYQNKLISQFIEENISGIDTFTIDGIRHINRVLNGILDNSASNTRNTTWKLLSMRFDNMFSYGPGNFINFENLNGIQGIFAPNASGKSSILEILTFILFDKCSKTFKAEDILNNRSENFYGEVNFDINGEIYTIKRTGIKGANKRVRVLVDFHNTSESLKGDERDDTNKIIRTYIGTYDDFMLTALSTQTDNRNFIFKTQKERKELLYSFLDLKIFTDLYRIAKIHISDKKAILSNLTDKTDIIISSELENTINENSLKIEKISSNIKDRKFELDRLNKEIKDSLLKIKPYQDIRDITDIQNEIQKNETVLQTILNNIPEYKLKLNELDGYIKHNPIITVDEDRYQQNKNLYVEVGKKIKQVTKDLEKIKHTISHHEKQINLLSDHKYDPNCKFCTDNEFVKTAESCKEELPSLRNDAESKETLINDLLDKFNELKSLITEYDDTINKNRLIKEKTLELSNLKSKIESYKIQYNNAKENISKLKLEEERYHSVENDIKENKRLKLYVTEQENKSVTVKESLERNEKAFITLTTENTRLKSKLESFKSNQEEINRIQSDINIYEIYLTCVAPLGIPYMLLTKILPVIESEMNNLLHGIADFTCELLHDEKSILCYINYGNDNSWPVELSSGMERFMTSVASRVALIEVTSLARPNFIAIDEGFGTLDANNMPAAYQLLDKIKDKFDFMMCITHLDSLRDAADNVIPIVKTNGFSYINYN